MNNKIKLACRHATYILIKNGVIDIKPCEVCGNTISQVHHLDYSDPMAVVWLCKKHHLEAHGKTEKVQEPGEKTVTIVLTLSQEQYQQVKTMAKNDCRSVPSFIQCLLHQCWTKPQATKSILNIFNVEARR